MPRGSHRCRECDYATLKWLGRCPECGAWGSLEAQTAPDRDPAPAAAPTAWPEVPSADVRRIATGSPELDRALGGGLVPGAVVLLGGEPGIGKSTLLLQCASALADGGLTVLYVSAEESLPQLRLRGDRLGVRGPSLLVLAETDVDAVVAAAREGVAAVVVDSVQAMRCGDVDSIPGSVAQVREAAARFVSLAKATGVPVLLVGHVTKDGSLAGPRVLEHAVDVVLQFSGDRHHAHRILRAVKNRFGPADEIGVFTMGDSGLRGVANPSALFLAERTTGAPGSAVLAAIEGTRPLLVEIQALVGEPREATPRRTALGVDPGRLALILAVLERRLGFDLGPRDVFVNVAGGLEVDEPAADLAIASAVASSLSGRPVRDRMVAFGEIGLAGEVRSVSRAEARLREAHRLGFEAALAPASAAAPAPDGMRVLPAKDIDAAIRTILA